MKEEQNVEFKEHWRYEYIKWMCGFANAQGRKLIIGVLYFMTYVFISQHGQKTWNTDCTDDADARGYDLPVFAIRRKQKSEIYD